MSNEQDGQKPKRPAVGSPVTTTRFIKSLPVAALPPAKRDDELTLALGKRDVQVKQLLQREFGSLAPPPLPSLRIGPSPRDAEARIRLDEIERRRKEYEALDSASLQALLDQANTERAEQVHSWIEDVQAKRELRWPHWAIKDLWSEAEFAALCCGFVPDERGIRGDPGKLAGDDSQAVAINRAADDIRRGTLSTTLAFVPRDDADTAARMYGTARHYVPAVAAEWAATRFNTFPASLLAAVRARARTSLEPVVPAVCRWPWGDHETKLLRDLAAAADRFWGLYDPTDATTAPTNEAVVKWLSERGVADRNAKVMATMLRADGLPTGPRK